MGLSLKKLQTAPKKDKKIGVARISTISNYYFQKSNLANYLIGND